MRVFAGRNELVHRLHARKEGVTRCAVCAFVDMDQEHMITLEDTDAAVKRCQQYLERAITDDASPKAKVLATEISATCRDLERDLRNKLPRLNLRHSRRLTTKAQDAKIKALSAQLRAKRAHNGDLVE